RAVFPARFGMINLLIAWCGEALRRLTFIEEHRSVTAEQFGTLVQRAVGRIRINDQLRIRQVLLQDVRIDRVDDDVIAAADDERRLFDVFQVIPGPVALGTPLGNSSALRQCGLLAYFGVAILGTEPKALKKFASCPWAGIGWREMNTEPKIVRIFIGRSEDLFAFRCTGIHALAATRSGADQN